MIQHVLVHKVGNKLNGEPLFLSKNALEIHEDMEILLSQYFLSSFKPEEHYRFYHDIDISLNEVFTCVSEIFGNTETLQEQSEHLARHLYSKSTHPKIKGGEFYVVYFTGCHLNGETVDAVGLFKSENRDTFLEVEQNMDGFDVESRQGININKLDKGCLIYHTDKENGYVLSIVDNTNKGTEAQYWKDEFLQVRIVNNDFHQTNQFMGIAKQFVTQQLDEEYDLSKADKIDYLNRSVDYFKNHEAFDKEEFAAEVFHHENVIDSFRKFDESYRREHEVELDDNFSISGQAVKKQARVFKSVLKLDKNFHIYIHGNRELIEQGTDENGRKFYKIYYENEA